MATQKSSAPAHPSTENRDDTAEANYSGLERLRPHACVDGRVFVGYVDEHDEEGETIYACRRCVDGPRGR